MSKCDFTFFLIKLTAFPFKIPGKNCFVPWPKGLPYLCWLNLLKKHLWFLGKSSKRSFRKGKAKSKSIFRQKNQSLEVTTQQAEIAQKQSTISSQKLMTLNPTGLETTKLELITLLKLFLEKKHVSHHIEEAIPDYRNQELTTYSKQSIMLSALSIFLLRLESGNNFDVKSQDSDEKYSRVNIAKFINAPEGSVPVIKTIENFLKRLGENSINDLMISFFKDLQQSKFFKQHPQIMPGDFFLLAADCVHTHTYDHLHHTDKQGNNDCPCCLKRVYNKGTENETVRWLHSTLVFSFVFMEGLKIPIYRYPIHAKQVVGLENAPENTHKQECELVGLKTALPIIRQAFPRMNMVLLLDGLYANKPVIRLAEEQDCGYIIVKKESSLPLLSKECDERAKDLNHKKNCVKRARKVNEKGWNVNQTSSQNFWDQDGER